MSNCPPHHYKIENKNGTEIGYCIKCGAVKKFPKLSHRIERAIVFSKSFTADTKPRGRYEVLDSRSDKV
jgi:hypothetical protein